MIVVVNMLKVKWNNVQYVSNDAVVQRPALTDWSVYISVVCGVSVRCVVCKALIKKGLMLRGTGR